MKVACPVGHPSGAGRHCPLCGRAYVPVEQVAVQDTCVAVPQPRHALDDSIALPPPAEDAPRLDIEALAMLSSLASDFDY